MEKWGPRERNRATTLSSDPTISSIFRGNEIHVLRRVMSSHAHHGMIDNRQTTATIEFSE